MLVLTPLAQINLVKKWSGLDSTILSHDGGDQRKKIV